MAKYPVSKEFFPFIKFAPPMSRRFTLLAQKGMKTPKLFVEGFCVGRPSPNVSGHGGGEIEIYILTPKALPEAGPCLVQMARDSGMRIKPLFQLLVYPWLDGRNDSKFHLRYTDTPMWNSTLCKRVGPIINPDPSASPLAYRSPAEAVSFNDLPPAYIEVAEFDCLHDDGILYAALLNKAGIEVEFHEVKETMHRFDTVFNAPTSQKMIAKRIEYMRKMFKEEV